MTQVRSSDRLNVDGRTRTALAACTRLLVFALLLASCLAKSMGPAKAATLAAATVSEAALVCLDTSVAGSTDTPRVPVTTICLTALHGAPLATGYELAFPAAERLSPWTGLWQPRPPSWTTNPPHRPPRLTA